MREPLARWLRDRWAADAVEITALAPLSGGAIQENWRVAADVSGGPREGRHDLVLRLDAASTLPFSHGRAAEYHLLRAAHAAGVTAPEPVALCEEAGVLGRAFLLMRRVDGAADPRALTAAGPHPGLARGFGTELARLHRIRPPHAGLDCLAAPPRDAARARVHEMRGLLDGLDQGRPALEWGLNWLWRNAPAPRPVALCHRDFRTGNVLVRDGRVTAVLDWEFAGWSDPAEDLGWVTAPCWRFRRPDLEAGGIGGLAELLEGYAAAGAAPPEPERLRWWQVMAVARWAVIALWQGRRHRSEFERSLELALTAHLAPELELELLAMTGG